MNKFLLSFFLLFLTSVYLSAKDIQTLVLTTTPQMHCAGCETKIKDRLRFEKGVKSIETSIENQTVTIKFDADKTSSEILVKSLEKIGYSARELQEGEAVEKREGETCPL